MANKKRGGGANVPVDDGLDWLTRVQTNMRRAGVSTPGLVKEQAAKDAAAKKKSESKSASSSTPPKPTPRPSGTNVSRKKAEAKKNGRDIGLKPTTTSPKPVKATALKNQPKNFTAGPPDRMRTSGSRKAPSLDFAMPSPTYDIGSSDTLAQANRDDFGR